MEGKRKKGLLTAGYWIMVILAAVGVGLFSMAEEAKGWLTENWGGVPIEEIVYQLKVPITTSLPQEAEKLFQAAVPVGILAGILVLVLFTAFRKCRVMAGILAILLAAGSTCSLPGIWREVQDTFPYEAYQEERERNPDVIETNYVDPRNVEITFPEKKRNLIYIFLESMENTYMSRPDGGAYDINYIPELTELAEKNLNFSHTDQVGGAYEVAGTRWTVASMFAQTSGLPLLIPIARNDMTFQELFFPKVWSLGNILEEQGYHQELMIGSDAVFGGRMQYFTQHGDYDIFDYSTAKYAKKFTSNYRVWWGYEDRKLFDYAKEEITRLAGEDEPFNFTMLTVDTHKENGWPCPLCRWEYGSDQYASVISCSSRQVAEFIAWIRQQDFYKDTTVILSSDHRTMDADFCLYIDEDYRRTLYNAFLNPSCEAENTTFRKFTAMDMFPTTLASMGVTIEGDRLGLGTNLFSEKKTLAEQIGVHNLTDQLEDAKENSTFWAHFTEEIVVEEE